MLKPFTSKTMFSMENHEDTTAEDLPEEGVVETADSESVVAVAEPSADVSEAGDDIGQATPNDSIDAEPEADITTTEDQPLEGSPSENVEEINKLTEDGEQAAAANTEIVETAVAEATGDSGADTDINGNAITPEQASENDAEEQVETEVDEEAEQTAADKDIHEQAEDVTDNVDEEIGDAIGADSTDGGLDGSATDDTSADIDAGGDQGDTGVDADMGGEGDAAGGDDLEAADDDALDADDTPLEGAEVEGGEDAELDATGSDTSDAGDLGGETSEGSDLPAETPAASEGGAGEDLEGDLEGADVDPVSEQVDDQNAAADVTAEAASADADQTDFIAGDTPEQHGDEPATDELPANDGGEVVAEAAPAEQNETDVSTANADSGAGGETADEVEFGEDDDTPLEGAEDLEVDVDESITPTEVDGQEADGPTGDGATVEESESDQQAEALDADVTEAEESESTDGEESTETESESTEETGDITSDGEPGIDAEAGEIEQTDEEADFDEGELDIPDVDDETTETEVEEATEEADEVEAEAEADDEQAEVADKTIEELQKEQESLEEFRVMLEFGLSNESYDAGLLAYINAKSNDTREKLNRVGCNIQAVSLESFDGRDLDLAYQASLESIRGMISRMSGFTHQLTQKLEHWWSKGMVDKVKKRTTAVNKLIDLSLVQLKDSDFSSKEINSLGAYLSHAEGNLVKAVADDLKMVTEVSTQGLKASEKLQTELVKAINDITGARTPEEATDVARSVAELKDIKSDFPARAFTTGFLGGRKFELKDGMKGSDLKDRILNMARRAVPVVVKEGKGEKTSQALTKGDVANLLKSAKAYVALADKLADTVGDRAVSNVGKIRLTRERALPITVEGRIRGGDEKAIDAAASAMELVAKAHNDLYKFITEHCVEVAEAICSVAKKATK